MYLTFPQLAPVAIWLIIFGIISWKQKKWGLFLIVFLLPSYLIRFKVVGVPTTMLEIMIYILFIMWLLQNITNTNLCRFFYKKALENKVLCLSLILLLGGTFIASLFSSQQLTSFGIAKGWFFDPFLVFLLMVSLSKKHTPLPQKLLETLALSGLACALISLIYAAAGQFTFDGRLRAFFLSPNHLAMYLAPCLIAYLGCFVCHPEGAKPLKDPERSSASDRDSSLPSVAQNDRRLLPNKLRNSPLRLDLSYVLKLLGGVIIASSLFLTYSYGAWLAITLALAFYRYSVTIRRKAVNTASSQSKSPPNLSLLSNDKKLLLYIAILLIGLGLIVGSQLDNPKLENIFETQRSSLHSRIMIWRSSVKILKDHWLWGIGPGMFQSYYLTYQKYFPPYLEWAVPQPHNIFLAFWLQTGLIGFIGFIGIIFWFFKKRDSRQLTADSRIKKTMVVTTAIMLYTLIHGLVDTPYWKNDLSVIFWVLVGSMLLIKGQESIPTISRRDL